MKSLPILIPSLLFGSVCCSLARNVQAVTSDATDFRQAYALLTERALEKAPDLQAAGALVRQRSGQSLSAWAHWLPKANIKLSSLTNKDHSQFATDGVNNSLFAGFQSEQTHYDSWTLSASLPLYQRATHLGVLQARAERASAESTLAARRSELDWKLSQRLGGYLLGLFREAAAQTALKGAKRSEQEVERRLQLGQRTRMDLLKAQANVNALEAQLIESEREILEQQSGLQTEYGITPADLSAAGFESWKGSEARLSDALTALYENAKPQLEKLKFYLDCTPEERQKQLSAKNLTWKTLIADAELAETRGSALLASEWPDLSLQASYGKTGNDWSQAFTTSEASYSYGIILNIPLSLGGGALGAYRESANARSAARIRLARDQQALMAQLENLRVQLLSLLKSFEAGQLRVSQNEEIQRLTQKTYELGKSGTLELLTAQNDLLSAKTDFASTKVKLSVLIHQMAWNLGVSTNE